MGRSIQEIMQLNPNVPEDFEIIRTEYLPVNIGQVKIAGNIYKNYGAYWFFWEKTFAKEPKRAMDGSMGNINNISTFLTGHLVIDYSIISIDDYRSLMRTHYEQNEVVVECYDPIYNNVARLKMYMATEERKKLYFINRNRQTQQGWEDWLMLAGVQDYQLEMIGTNNDLDLATVTYNLNAPADTGNTTTIIGSDETYIGGDFICGNGVTYDVLNETFNGKYKFAGWNISKYGGDTGNYINGSVYDLQGNMVLYAKWESVATRTLSFSYGEFKPDNIDVFTKTVSKGKAIGELLAIPTNPSVTYNEAKYYPYKNGGWYKTATKGTNSNPITASTLYWADTDDQVYLIYDVEKYTATYVVEGKTYQTESVAYNSALPKPTPAKEGYTFSGWFIDSNYKTQAPTLMPPTAITLYGKWNK